MSLVRPALQSDLITLGAIWHENRLVQQQFDARLRLAADAPARWQAAAAAWLASPECHMLMIEKQGRALGYIVGRIEAAPPGLLPDRLGIIIELNADAHARESGVGRALLGALRLWFGEQGVEQLAARTVGQSAVEQAFWRAQGAVDWMAWLWLNS
jgi:GNAT superfamily N-acetyltransferase